MAVSQARTRKINAAYEQLNAHQVTMLQTVEFWTPQYRQGVVSNFRLDGRSVNALERLELVVKHTMPVEGCKLTPLGRQVLALANTMTQARKGRR
jgi:RIO-like serine/threonine protein kinase